MLRMMKLVIQLILASCLALTLVYLPVFATSTPDHPGGGSTPLPKNKRIKPIKSDVTALTQLEPIAAAPAVTTAPEGSGSLSEWLYKLRMCESGGNYAINTGNGFYGAYQFTIDTWNSLGTAYDRADLAPADVQDQAIIANTNRNSGGLATQNPGCYQKEGLSAFPPS